MDRPLLFIYLRWLACFLPRPTTIGIRTYAEHNLLIKPHMGRNYSWALRASGTVESDLFVSVSFAREGERPSGKTRRNFQYRDYCK